MSFEAVISEFPVKFEQLKFTDKFWDSMSNSFTPECTTEDMPDAWPGLLSQLCDLLVPEGMARKLRGSLPEEEGNARILRSMFIPIDENGLKGNLEEHPKLELVIRLLSIANNLRRSQSSDSPKDPQRLQTVSNQLNIGCKNLKALQIGGYGLFERRRDLQALQDAHSKERLTPSWGPQLAELQKDQARAEQALNKFPAKVATDNAQELLEARSAVEHGLGAFTTKITEFQRACTEEIDPWIRNVKNLSEDDSTATLVMQVDSASRQLDEILSSAALLRSACEELHNRAQKTGAANSFLNTQMLDSAHCASQMLSRVH